MSNDSSGALQDTTLDDLIDLARQKGSGLEETIDELIAEKKLVPRERLIDALERSERLEVLVSDAMELISTAPHEFRHVWHDWLNEAKAVINPPITT